MEIGQKYALIIGIKAFVVLTKMFLKEMVARNKGRILNVGSIAGEMPGAFF